MKKLIILIISIVFLFSGIAIAGDKKNKKREGKRFKDKRGHEYVEKHGRFTRIYHDNHPYHHPKGKRYGHYRNHRLKRYQGHKFERHYTWREWHKIRKHKRYRKGRYHHDDNKYLMFSFCDNRGICFSVGIGD